MTREATLITTTSVWSLKKISSLPINCESLPQNDGLSQGDVILRRPTRLKVIWHGLNGRRRIFLSRCQSLCGFRSESDLMIGPGSGIEILRSPRFRSTYWEIFSFQASSHCESLPQNDRQMLNFEPCNLYSRKPGSLQMSPMGHITA